MKMDDPWAVLGLQPGATKDQVRSAWHAVANREHPDRGGDPERFRLAKAAFDFLSQVAPEEPAPQATGPVGPTSPGPVPPRQTPSPLPRIPLREPTWLERLAPFGLAATALRAACFPARCVSFFAATIGGGLVPRKSRSALRAVPLGLMLWPLSACVTLLFWLAAAMAANMVDPSGTVAFALALLAACWWLSLTRHFVVAVVRRVRAAWVGYWGLEGREARQARRDATEMYCRWTYWDMDPYH